MSQANLRQKNECMPTGSQWAEGSGFSALDGRFSAITGTPAYRVCAHSLVVSQQRYASSTSAEDRVNCVGDGGMGLTSRNSTFQETSKLHYVGRAREINLPLESKVSAHPLCVTALNSESTCLREPQ